MTRLIDHRQPKGCDNNSFVLSKSLIHSQQTMIEAMQNSRFPSIGTCLICEEFLVRDTAFKNMENANVDASISPIRLWHVFHRLGH